MKNTEIETCSGQSAAWRSHAFAQGLLRSVLFVSLLAVATASPAVEEQPIHWQAQQQLVTVVSADWDATTAILRRYERIGDQWQPIGDAIDVNLGRSGSAWGLGLHPPQAGVQKREGDGRAPAGVFAIGQAFGYAEVANTVLEYQPMLASHVCVDVSTSPLYNQIVDTRAVGEAAVAGNTEPMRRDLQQPGDDLYQLGFVIAHNPQAVANAGSCIFAHVWRGQGMPTAGCTAMDATAMQAVLAWLDGRRQPRFVLLPAAQYGELRESWDLPPNH